MTNQNQLTEDLRTATESVAALERKLRSELSSGASDEQAETVEKELLTAKRQVLRLEAQIKKARDTEADNEQKALEEKKSQALNEVANQHKLLIDRIAAVNDASAALANAIAAIGEPGNANPYIAARFRALQMGLEVGAPSRLPEVDGKGYGAFKRLIFVMQTLSDEVIRQAAYKAR